MQANSSNHSIETKLKDKYSKAAVNYKEVEILTRRDTAEDKRIKELLKEKGYKKESIEEILKWYQ
jgi:hypothetical protein